MVYRTFFPSRWRSALALLVTSLVLTIGLHRPLQAQPSDPAQWLQQAEQAYYDHEYETAIALWEQAAEAFHLQDDGLREAIALGNQARALQALGQWTAADVAIQASLRRLDDLPSTPGQTQARAQGLDILGQQYFETGQPRAALDTWTESADLYQSMAQPPAALQSQLNQAQSLQALGFYRQAREQLNALLPSLDGQDAALQARGWISLGQVEQVVAPQMEEAEELLIQGRDAACEARSPEWVSQALLGLGDLYRGQYIRAQNLRRSNDAQQLLRQSLGQYRQILSPYDCGGFTLDLPHQRQAQIRLVTLQAYAGQPLEMDPEAIARPLLAEPPRWTTIDQQLSLAHGLLMQLDPAEGCTGDPGHQALPAQLLTQAYQGAQTLEDGRSQSRALGYLGHWYQAQGACTAAERSLTQALQIAQDHGFSDLSYQWQAQLGHLRLQQGNREGAIAAYGTAVNTLQTLRRDLVWANADLQFSFQRQVEPVYRALVAQLLQPDASNPDLRQARETMDALQTLQIENYLRQSCNTTDLSTIDRLVDQTAPHTAFVYTILLSDRLELILKLPNSEALQHYAVAVDRQTVTTTLNHFRAALEKTSFDFEYRNVQRSGYDLSQQLYTWLVAPYEAALQPADISTLVFVLDEELRQLPVAALYDGNQFLIEKGYAVAINPGLALLPPGQPDLNPVTTLTAGITEALSGFKALPAVDEELEAIATYTQANILRNEAFTKAALANGVESVPAAIVHLATHGEFSDDLNDTFILAWDTRISLPDLSQILAARDQSLPQAIELLVLSACKTADGNPQAALGLAGMAVQSGARSTLATLWVVNDATTARLMARFYQELAQSPSKAEALRRAQVALMQEGDQIKPFHWAPFVLVGNWL
ncbi:CHAT domain-containing protein [Leptolyngbya sp. CCY15150]|uniref:CHAT domain-containing protein n=1 Tax=Leptolyngbya sp. CCY15150 TaxID=2767772 RepID=UPI00194E6080|nr:CHAT domain-containing protein [Leptolyngbya sp. CCY15150]